MGVDGILFCYHFGELDFDSKQSANNYLDAKSSSIVLRGQHNKQQHMMAMHYGMLPCV
jgi:hypothetical protein